MIELKRLMLAVKANDLDALTYPLLASSKIDGIRATVKDGVLLSRTMTPIPNKFTQFLFGNTYFNGLDGELVVGSATNKNCMQNTLSGVMTQDGEPGVTWNIFDNWSLDGEYWTRARETKRQVENEGGSLLWLTQTLINTPDELRAYEEKQVNLGYEGVIVRSPFAPYKQNRSTLKQGYMLKIKRFKDSEAEILSCFEQQKNNNEATVDERGYTKRSTHAGNKEAAGVLGGFHVRDIYSGVEFDVGTGFSAEQRKNLWEGKKYLPGKLIKYKFFPVGVVDKPRFPTYLGFRDRRDL